jgi:hypothetical protein
MIRYLIDAQLINVRYPVSRPQALYGTVQDVGKRGLTHLEKLRRRFLGHDLTEQQDQVFQPVGNARVTIRPWDSFLDATVSRALDLAGSIKKGYASHIL